MNDNKEIMVDSIIDELDDVMWYLFKPTTLHSCKFYFKQIHIVNFSGLTDEFSKPMCGIDITLEKPHVRYLDFISIFTDKYIDYRNRSILFELDTKDATCNFILDDNNKHNSEFCTGCKQWIFKNYTRLPNVLLTAYNTTIIFKYSRHGRQ